jgi:hypothetical protein
MKAGDKVWAVTTVVSVEPNGVIYGDWDMHDPACVIPHTEALPAVARWLAETPGAVEALRIVGMSAVQDRSVPLRHIEKYGALLAALTTEEPA